MATIQAETQKPRTKAVKFGMKGRDFAQKTDFKRLDVEQKAAAGWWWQREEVGETGWWMSFIEREDSGKRRLVQSVWVGPCVSRVGSGENNEFSYEH